MFPRRILLCARNVLHCTSRDATAIKGINRQAVESKKDLLTTLLEGRSIKSPEEWIQVRKEILNEKTHITTQNIDAMMLGFYTNSDNYHMAVKFVNFLKSQNVKMNLATTGKYFRLFYLVNNKKDIEEADEKELIYTYEDIRKRYPVLDPITLDNIIEGLSLTSKWRTCLDLLKEVKVTATPTTSTYNSIVSALFRNGEEDLGWKLLQEMLENVRDPKASTFKAFLDHVDRNYKSREHISMKLETLFKFLQENDIKCDLEFAGDLSKFLNNHGFAAKFTDISDRGQCRWCKRNLKKFEIATNEFGSLKKSIIEKAIIGRDVFNKSTPAELQRFTDFIDGKQIYDVVIDGLNVAYSAGTKHKPDVHCSLISAVVNHFRRLNKKVLLLGRQHMNKWRQFKYITQDIDVFLTSDASHDDPYLLYCALHSGENTIIVSRDLMRGHKFLLKQYKLKLLFNRWLSQRLYQLKFVDKNGTAIFLMPPQFTISSQKVEDCWHIPCISPDNSKTKALHTSWLCVTL